MNKTTDPTKLSKLHELDSLQPREIRGQSHTLPRIVSAVRRGELGLTRPRARVGAFSCNDDPNDTGIAGVDIYKMDGDGKAIEHWDTLQVVGDPLGATSM